ERFNVFKNDKKHMVVALLHSAGAGKTTACRETILGQTEIPFIYFYIAPRTKLLAEEKERVKKMTDKKNISCRYIDADNKSKNKDAQQSKVVVKGKNHDYIEESNKEGNIKNIVQQLLNHDFSTHEHIFVGLTTQSFLENPLGKDTATYLRKLFEKDMTNAKLPFYRHGYKIAIVLDEALGSDNGIQAINDMIMFMNSVSSTQESNIIFFILDANLHSGLVFEKVLRQFEKLNYIAPSLYTTDFKKEHTFTYKNIDIYAYSDFSYPAKSLKYTCRYVETQNRLLKTIKEYVASTIRRNEKVFIYVQDKTLVYTIYNAIRNITIGKGIDKKNGKEIDEKIDNEEYIKVGFYSSTAESEKENNFSQYNVIISTSTLSRGIDLSDNWTKTIIVDNIENMFNTVEQQLVEEIQAIARMRGMKDENNKSIDDKVEKEVIKILYINIRAHEDKYKNFINDRLISIQEELKYINRKEIEELFKLDNKYNLKQFIRELNEITKKVLLSFIKPENREKLIVPIPSQLTKRYQPSTIEPIVNLIEDLKRIKHLMKTKEEEMAIKKYYQALAKLFTMYTDIDDSDKDNEIGYGLFKGYINAKVIKPQLDDIKANKEDIKRILLQNKADDLAHSLDETINELVELSETHVNTYIYIPLYALQKEKIIQHEIEIQRRYSIGKAKIKSLIPENIETEITTKNNKEGLITFTFPLAEGADLQIGMMSFPTIPLSIVNLIL
ncbi:MAG: hypothetical protein QXH07_07830, partial [Thermoplasmata archaeon]